ncbi:hypothetical protein ACLMJK_004895 [Lecanora helva]
MDPVSVAASLLTLLGAASTAGRALEHLSNIRHAPDQLLALMNEVADLRVVLSKARETVQERSVVSQDCTSLGKIVERANQKVRELNRLIYRDLVKKGCHFEDDKPKASHVAFFRHHGKIKALKEEIREVKLSLLIAIGALTFADVSQLKLRLCNFDVVQTNALEERQAEGGAVEPYIKTKPSESTSRTPSNIPGVTYCPNTPGDWTDWELPLKSLAPRPTTPSDLAPVNTVLANGSKGSRDNSHIRVEASVVPPRSCDQYCLCQCHKVTSLSTPSAYTNVIGKLFVGYAGLPLLSHQKCNRISCRQGRTQTQLRIAYLFPVWFALRLIAFTLTKASTTFMWTLSFPVVTQSATPVVIQVSLGNVFGVQSLLSSREATINTIDVIASKSPLHVALQFRQTDMICFLIQQGADMYVQDCNNKTPLDTYYENYFTTPEELRMTAVLPLFEKHDVVDHWNLKYIHLIILGCATVDLATYLTISEDEIDVVDSWGRTALMWAAWRGDSASVSLLLEFGASSQATSYDGNSVLIYATYGGSLDCLRLILGTGAYINHISHSILTPAMGGSRLGDNPAIAKVRIERGAAIEASRQQNFSPLYVAALSNRTESLKYLLDYGASTDETGWNCSTPMSLAISFNNHQMVKELIKAGADVNTAPAFTTSYLRSAAVFGDEKLIQVMKVAEPAIDVDMKDAQGYTARCRMKERLLSMDSADPRKQRIATAFEELVEVCSANYSKAHRSCWQTAEIEKDFHDDHDTFYDATES